MSKPKAPTVRYLNRPDVPELFVSETPNFWASAGNLHMTFATARYDHTADPAIDRQVVARLVMPGSAALAFAQQLWAFLQANGMDPGAKPQGVDVQ